LATEKEVETVNPFPAEKLKETKVGDAHSKIGSGQPSAEEIARLTSVKLRNYRIHAQELHNRFARLLNRGSSLE
jgi:hypothetical protein